MVGACLAMLAALEQTDLLGLASLAVFLGRRRAQHEHHAEGAGHLSAELGALPAAPATGECAGWQALLSRERA